MKNLTISNTKRVNAKAANAKTELSNVSRNIMYYVRHLNTLAKKGEFTNGVNIRDFGKECQMIHGQKDLYHASLLFNSKYFLRDSRGRVCRIALSVKCPAFGFDIQDVTKSGWSYLRPVSLSDRSVLSAFIAVVRGNANASDKAEREKEKAEKATEKEYSKALKALQNEFKKGNITGATFRAEWAKLDAKYNK